MLIVGGTSLAGPETGGPAPDWLAGMYHDDNRIVVPYPASLWPLTPDRPTLGVSVADGVSSAESLVPADGETVIVGTSQGALVVDQIIADGNLDPNSVQFVVIDDPDRGTGLLTPLRGIDIPILDYTPINNVATPYDVTVVIKEYDGIADFPDRPWNLVADANALLGAYYYHPSSVNSDLASVPAQNITTVTNAKGGTTTTYLVPTPQLPLTQPLRDIGVPAPVVNDLDRVLRPVVDAGYSRNDPKRTQNPTTDAHLVRKSLGSPKIGSPKHERSTARHVGKH